MKTVFEAANAVEAHMVRDLLHREGIAAHIHGEHLQGAMGELPAAGLVRLVVDEADYPRGRAVIDAWEAAQPADTAPRSTAASGPRVLVGFLVGLAVGAALTWSFFQAAVTADGIDYDQDGRLDDRWFYSAGGLPLRSEVDRNGDGKVDQVTRFDRRGLPATGETDDDFDGVFEGRQVYRDGTVELAETDTDGDGTMDLRSHSRHGVLQTTEYLDPQGRVLRVEHFRLGKLSRAEVDTDRDGVLDTEQEYGALGELRGTRRLAAP